MGGYVGVSSVGLMSAMNVVLEFTDCIPVDAFKRAFVVVLAIW